jgi:hypothetical protein
MLELRILTGLHRGAALPLDGDAIRIGSAAENDIVLLDPGMPALAGAIYRSEESTWRYRSGAPTPSNDEPSDGSHSSDNTLLIAGARWFAGPVLIGCDEEGSPWPSAQPRASVEEGPQAAARQMSTRSASSVNSVASVASVNPRRSFKAKPLFALAAAIGLASLIAASIWRSQRGGGIPPGTAASSAPTANDGARAPVRVVDGIVYPAQAMRRPPFEIRSATTGPYGFVVTRDDQVLMPGSRLGAFTLVSIEPRRAVFSGPHPAELTW